MLVLFQEGIPDIFFPELVKRGFTTLRFSTSPHEAARTFAAHSNAAAIFFRANFHMSASMLDLLPKLQLAALVSTGTDNVDAGALRNRGIRLTTGDGANARAVFDYVIQALCAGNFDFERERLGVVGAGRIGRMLIEFFHKLGAQVSYYDPLLEEPGSLSDVLSADVVTFHVPLTTAGPHATQGMLNAGYFSTVQKPLRIIQSCRGGIWDNEFYRQLRSHPLIKILAQDVYPEEPPATEVLSCAQYSTPHIAGYSTRGRLGGIVKGIAALLPGFEAEARYPAGAAWFLQNEAGAFAAKFTEFNALRDRYPWRKEFHEYDEAERTAYLTRFKRLPPNLGDSLFRL